MYGINTFTVSGNLTRDPEARTTPSGSVVVNGGIAHNERRKVNGEWQDVPQYFDWVAFGKFAESLSRLKKGQSVVLSGSLGYSTWEAKDGSKRSKVELVVRDAVTPKSGSQNASQGVSGGTSDNRGDFYDENIPF